MLKLLQKALLPLASLVLVACSESAPTPDPMLVKGEEIYKANCKVCHAQGINGAPIVGNKKMWKERAPQGLSTLVQHASEGYGLMPAKGGNDSLTTDDLTAAISFMLSKLDDTSK